MFYLHLNLQLFAFSSSPNTANQKDHYTIAKQWLCPIPLCKCYNLNLHHNGNKWNPDQANEHHRQTPRWWWRCSVSHSHSLYSCFAQNDLELSRAVCVTFQARIVFVFCPISPWRQLVPVQQDAEKGRLDHANVPPRHLCLLIAHYVELKRHFDTTFASSGEWVKVWLSRKWVP